MVVSVSFSGLQREQAQTDRIKVPLSDNVQRVDDLFGYIKENYPELSINRGMVLVTVNNHISSPEQGLQADDEVSFIPHIGGG
ncbi:MAG: MoaD/ThiS family protein [Deltaproteobacteria bacterium]|nr:MoaD/ThiS family protein [Deltaproteobacteria bacterium]